MPGAHRATSSAPPKRRSKYPVRVRRSHLGNDRQDHRPAPRPLVDERVQRVADLADEIADVRLATIVASQGRRHAFARLLEQTTLRIVGVGLQKPTRDEVGPTEQLAWVSAGRLQ